MSRLDKLYKEIYPENELPEPLIKWLVVHFHHPVMRLRSFIILMLVHGIGDAFGIVAITGATFPLLTCIAMFSLTRHYSDFIRTGKR